MANAFSDWVNRFLIGPRHAVTQTLADESAERRDEAQARRRLEEQSREQSFRTSERLGTERAASERQRENITLTQRLAEEARRRTEAEDQTARERLAALAGVVTRGAPSGEPSEPTPPEALLGVKGGREVYTQLRPKPQEHVVTPAPGRTSIITRGGEEIGRFSGPELKRPVPWVDYNPLTTEIIESEGKFTPRKHAPSVPELRAIVADLEWQKRQGQPVDERALTQAKSVLRDEEAYQGRLMEKRAQTAYDWSKPTEAEEKALQWIEGLHFFSNRFNEFTPDQLRAVTTLPRWLAAKGTTTLKGTLPSVFGRPGEAEQTFAAIDALMAEAEQLGFKLGGQQLTPMEKQTVMAFVPNRYDLVNPVTLQAKLRNLRQSLDVIKEMRLLRTRTPRGALTEDAYDVMLGKALAVAGIKKTLTPTKDKDGEWK